MGSDTFSDINNILENDRADTSYKYALLRAVIESARKYPQYAKPCSGRVTLPLGICVFKWMMYYYPFFLPGMFIVLKNGEGTGPRKLQFRGEFEEVCGYYETRGGISVFSDDLLDGSVPEEILPVVVSLVNQIRTVITSKPMKHFGYSQSGSQYSMFTPEEKAVPFSKHESVSLSALINRCGSYSVSEELYQVFRDLGGFILGTGTISERWTAFLLKTNPEIPESELLKRFSIVPVSQRNTATASNFYHSLLESSGCLCVWSDTKLRHESLVVDHLLPFAVWHSNELWNLMPVEKKVNGRKYDHIPTPERLRSRKQEILGYWDLLYQQFPMQFERGITVGLLGGKMGENWKDQAFEQLCTTAEYLIRVRGYQAW